MKKLFTSAIIVLAFLNISTGLFAQNVYIPDPTFKSHLVNDPSINLNSDAHIQVSEAIAYTGGIYVDEAGISDLTGIEAFINITGLSCSSNGLANLNLSSNPDLTYLSCGNNFLTSLDVSNNTLLTDLSCGSNFLTSLDLSGNTALTNLECSNNSINSLDLSANTTLTNLSCGSNNLTNLDLSANTALTNLYCSYNNMTSLNLPSNNTLIDLDCSHNQLASLDVSTNTTLTYLYCSYNQLTCLDLSADTALTNIDCSHNQLTGLNAQNGHYLSITYFSSTGNPNLSCIQVDNVNYSYTYWYYDGSSGFDTNCGYIPPSVWFYNSSPVCVGSPIVFIDQSSNANSWNWDFGDGNTSTLQNPLHTYDDPGNYTVHLIVSNCFGSDTMSTLIIQGSDVYGHVSYTGGDVTNGFALIYPYEPYYVSFDTVQIQPLDGSGNYYFSNIPQGDYLVKIFADSIDYPTLIPTYSYQEWAWDSAAVILHGCVYNDTANVVMIELAPVSGIGLLHGQIIEGAGFGRAPGDPVHGVDVKLGVTGTPTIVASTTTDINGQYAFDNLSFGDYTVYADIPGLERDSSYSLTLDITNNQFLNLDYVVDSSSIFIIPNIGIDNYSSGDSYEFNVYPNPVKENATIRYIINSDANVQLEVYNIYGVKIQSLLNAHVQNGEYYYNFNPKSNNLKPGVYFISLSADGKTKTIRIIVM